MSSRCDYIIGNSLVRIEGRGAYLNNNSCFGPFRGSAADLPLAMHFYTQDPVSDTMAGLAKTLVTEYDFMDLHGALYAVDEGYAVRLQTLSQEVFWARYTYGSPVIHSNVAYKDFPPPFLLYHLLRCMYSFCALPLQIVPVHASTVVYNQKAVLFIAPSGTGKSTHTELWRTHIPGTGWLNDDSPLLKITPGGPRAYGSPWSGKLPVYINQSYPLAAVVRIYQASHNKMQKQPVLDSIGLMMTSCSSLLMQDSRQLDKLCAIFSQMLQTVPVYTLDCLPNKEAAVLAFQTLTQDGCL